MTLDDGTKELDRLFTRIDQSPWRERQKSFKMPNDATDFADASGWADVREGLSGSSSGGNALENGQLDSGPADEAADIDDSENDLPGWDYVEVQGTWEVTWLVDANGPYNQSLNFTQAASAASDEVYFEQIIPIAAYRRLVLTVRHSADNSNMGMKMDVAFLDYDEAIIGSANTLTTSITTEQTTRMWNEPPALAVFARIRVGIVNAAGTAGQTANILFMTTEEPTVYFVEVPGVKSFLTPVASNDYMMPYPSDVIPNGVYKAPLDGFVIGLSVKTDDTISAGTITARTENDTQATTPGPTVALSSGVTAGDATFSLDGVSAFHFDEGDELHIELSADGSLASTGSADYYGSLLLMFVVNDHGDW